MRAGTERRLRRAVARRAGAEPGGWSLAACGYCGLGLFVDWRDAQRLEFRTLVWLDDDEFDFGPGDEPAHLDHIIPECRNGSTSLDNTVISCAPCNLAKGDSALGDPEFLRWLHYRRFTVIATHAPHLMMDRIAEVSR